MSESRRFTLETQVDTTGAREGFNEITREAGAMANAVRETSQRAQAGVSGIGDGAASSATKVAAAERNLVGSIQRTTAALQSGSKSSADYYAALGQQRGIDPTVLDPYLAKLREQERIQDRVSTSVGGAKSQMNQFGVSTGQTTAALRQLPAQMSDIVSSLAGGQNPLMVLIQQGGQIKDSFGGVDAAIGGIGGAIKGLFSTTASGAGAMRGLASSQTAVADGAQQVAESMGQLTDGVTGAADSVNELADASDTVRNALGGLRNLPPTTVFRVGLAAAAAGTAALTAVVGGLGYAYNKGANEAGAFTRAIILSGNAAGASLDQVNEAARQIGAVTGNRGAAAAAVNELVATGQVSVENMQRFGAVAIAVEKDIGRAVSETAADFAALGEDPVAALKKIDEKYHIITASTYAQVKALKEQGKASEAADVAQNAYADGIEKQRSKVAATLSDWERGWIRIKNGISGAADSVIDFAMGRDKTSYEKIKKLTDEQDKLAEDKRRAEAQGYLANAAAFQAQIDSKTREINKIREGGAATKEAAKEEATENSAKALKNRYLDESNILLSRQEQLKRALAAADNEGAENKLTPDEISNRKAVIRKQFDDVAVAGVERQIAAIQRLAAVEDARSQRRLLQISGARAAGDLTEDAAIKKTAAEELAAIDRRIAEKQAELSKVRGRSGSESEQDSLAGEIATLREDKITRVVQKENDLAAVQRQRASETEALSNAGIVSAQSERQSLQDSVKAQREYNEEIGLTADEVQSLRITRQEALAVAKDEAAVAQEALEPGGQLAQIYRDQAGAIRERYMAERAAAAKQKDPWTNLSLAVKQYSDEANNAGMHIGDGLVNGMRSAEDAFASFVTTGKLGFSGFATSVISDLARIEARKGFSALLSMGMNALGSYFGAPSASVGDYNFTPTNLDTSVPFLDFLSGARANGGPVTGGASYLVGERGPEIFTPSSTGAITPNHMLGKAMASTAAAGSMAPITVITNVTTSGAQTTVSGADGQSKAMGEALTEKIKAVISQEQRQGGMIWKLAQGR
jgi:lambda family phage tail tape measure protein